MTPTVTDDFVNFSSFSVDPCETIQIKRYKSSKTGLTAVHADIEGPLYSMMMGVHTHWNSN
ncbi:hypothetical protein MBANPS3_002498 [Mucor bainieri]